MGNVEVEEWFEVQKLEGKPVGYTTTAAPLLPSFL
jgi:hypothetical protein